MPSSPRRAPRPRGAARAQSADRTPAARPRVREVLLLQRLVGESDAEVREAIGEAIGRLPLESPAVAGRVEEALVAIVSRLEVTSRIDKQAAGGRIVGLTLTPTREALVPMPALIGGLRGLEALARAKGRAKQPLMPGTVERLRSLATDDQATSDARNRSGSRQEEAARARRLATLCLLPVGAVSARAGDAAHGGFGRAGAPPWRSRRLPPTARQSTAASRTRPGWFAMKRCGRTGGDSRPARAAPQSSMPSGTRPTTWRCWR